MLTLFVLTPVSLVAFEPGLMTDQVGGYGGFDDETYGDYSITFIPRFSFLIGEAGDVFISGGATLDYDGDTFSVIPELLRTEFLWRFDDATIKLGRMEYTDPLGFIADGLFDGAQFQYNTPAGTFGLGAWYTGLLYKSRSYITITPEDAYSYFSDVDMDNVADTYFAPRRIVVAADWEHPFIGETAQLNATVIMQADLTGVDNPYHSQYAAVKLALPVSIFELELGGTLEIIEYKDELNIALAGEAGVYWTPPTPFHSRLSFNGRFSSGTVENSPLVAFSPITSYPQGDILYAKFSGLSILSLDYTARLHRTFSAGVTASYFVRSDLGTYAGYPISEPAEHKNEYFLGSELVAKFMWSPLSDLHLNAGIGVFLPSLGNAAPKAEKQWRLELGIIMAVF